MTLNNFIKTWLILFTICMLFVAFVNIFIDPYSLWNKPRIVSVNELKPASLNRSRLVKAHQLRNFKANTLIMGNSRPEMGLDPESHCWPEHFFPVYNQAIPGVSIYQQYRLLQHSTSFHKPGQIILTVDFNDFISARPLHKVIWPPENDIENLSVAIDGKINTKYPLSVVLEQLKVTFSLTAFLDSLYTLFSQSDPYSSNLTKAGFNTANNYRKIIATEGQAVIFRQKNISMIQRMNRPMYLVNENGWSQDFVTYREILQYGKEKNINITVFINPYHSDYLEIIRQSGHWDLFIRWKEKIAQITQNFNNVSLWDFALVNDFTTETAPEKGVRNKKINWFWEPAHYNKDYGEQILAQIFKTSCTNKQDHLISGFEIIDLNSYGEKLKNQEALLRATGSVSKITKLLSK